MIENEYKGILDRKISVQSAIDVYSNQIALLQDLTNYGTNLIPRAFKSSEKKLPEIIVIAVLLKQVVAMLDGAEILISQSAIHAAHLEARAAYEASIYIDWILNSEKDKKAQYYYVSNLRNERLWALRCIQGTEERDKFSSLRDELNHDILKENPDLEAEAKNHLTNVNRILSQQEFKTVDKHFEKLKTNDRHKREPIWYSPLGVNSIRQIAKNVNRLSEYDIFYAKGSQVTHSSSYKDHIIIGKGKFNLKPLRSLEENHTLLNFLVSIILKTYRTVLGHYRPGELQNFSRKYVESWREDFRAIKQVKYKSTAEETII